MANGKVLLIALLPLVSCVSLLYVAISFRRQTCLDVFPGYNQSNASASFTMEYSRPTEITVFYVLPHRGKAQIPTRTIL